jgi:hypothetical protein
MQFTPEEILAVVLREVVSVGRSWRTDWSDFDGQELKSQLDAIAKWAESALNGKAEEEYTEESEWAAELAGRR